MTWVGVAIGAGVGLASSLAMPAIQGKPITWEGALMGTALGGIGGGIGSALAPAAGAATTGAEQAVAQGTEQAVNQGTQQAALQSTGQIVGSNAGGAGFDAAMKGTTEAVTGGLKNATIGNVGGAGGGLGEIGGAGLTSNAGGTGLNNALTQASSSFMKPAAGAAPWAGETMVPTAQLETIAPSDGISGMLKQGFNAVKDRPYSVAGGLAGAGLGNMMMPTKGSSSNGSSAESIYDPIPYSQTDIPRTTVPQYYPYAEGGIVPPQPQQAAQAQQAAQPINTFAQMGMQSAQQLAMANQPQQPQAPQAGIPMPQPQQTFADGGLTSGMPGAGMLKGAYDAGIGKSVAPEIGNTLFEDKKHAEFLQQVQEGINKQLAQNASVQPVAPIQPVTSINSVAPIQPVQKAAVGGIMQDNLGGYSHGGIAGLTRGPGDGVSDSIPAEIGTSGKQPARLADGEFVISSRIVSELGNGSTEAGAKALQAMVDRIQSRRKKSIGKGKVAVDSKARKELLG